MRKVLTWTLPLSGTSTALRNSCQMAGGSMPSTTANGPLRFRSMNRMCGPNSLHCPAFELEGRGLPRLSFRWKHTTLRWTLLGFGRQLPIHNMCNGPAVKKRMPQRKMSQTFFRFAKFCVYAAYVSRFPFAPIKAVSARTASFTPFATRLL